MAAHLSSAQKKNAGFITRHRSQGGEGKSEPSSRSWGDYLLYSAGFTLVGAGCVMFLFPSIRDSCYSYLTGSDPRVERERARARRKDKRQTHKTLLVLKDLKCKFEKILEEYRDASREVSLCVRQLGCSVGGEIKTPFGRAIVQDWREKDGMVVSRLLWGGQLTAPPFDNGFAASGESGVEGSSYYFFRSDGSKVKNKWDSYNIEEELRKLDEIDDDPAPSKNELRKHPEKTVKRVEFSILEIERLQLKVDSVDAPHNFPEGAEKIRKLRKQFITNIEITLNEAEEILALGNRVLAYLGLERRGASRRGAAPKE